MNSSIRILFCLALLSLIALNLSNCISDDDSESGCTCSSASNFDPEAVEDDGSCRGCTDRSASNYLSCASVDDGSCIIEIQGCIDASAANFDATANTDDGSCYYLPDVDTYEITEFSYTVASIRGLLVDDGNSAITDFGVVWGTSQTPTLESSNSMSSDAISEGYFTVNLTDLTETTEYYVRAFATNEAGTQYGDELTFTTLTIPDPVAVGDLYQGGIVAYILQDGDIGYDENVQHGLIVQVENVDEITRYWGCEGTLVGADGLGIGSGLANTMAIANGCEETTPGSICYYLVLNEYNDWYLPSYDEFDEILDEETRTLIDQTAEENDLTAIGSTAWWTSSESSAFGAYAISNCFACGGGTEAESKDHNLRRTRCIRSF